MRSNIVWLFFLLLTFIITMPVSWLALAKVDFFYSTLHDSIGIDVHIQRFAPRNRFNKTDFEKTTKAERVALFHEVVVAIHNKGDGLASLSYTLPNKQKTTLFTEAEVIHLKDVANLLEKLKPLVLIAIVIWLLSMLWMFWKRVKFPSAKKFTVLSLAWLGITALVLLLGPEKVFNQLHIWVFPKNHQWFFYYEESLMSTMMKAPHLFAYISAIWVLLSIILTILLLKIAHLILSFRR